MKLPARTAAADPAMKCVLLGIGIMSAFNGYRTGYYRTFSIGYATPAQREPPNDAHGHERAPHSLACARPFRSGTGSGWYG